MCRRHELSAAAHTSAPVSSDASNLVREDRRRRVGVLDGERPAEAAALGRVGQVDELEPPHGAQEPVRRVADPQHPQRMAGRVVGDPVRKRGADVLEPEPADEQLAQLQHARRERGDLALERGIALGEPG